MDGSGSLVLGGAEVTLRDAPFWKVVVDAVSVAAKINGRSTPTPPGPASRERPQVVTNRSLIIRHLRRRKPLGGAGLQRS